MIVIVNDVSPLPTETAIVADFSRQMDVEINAIGVGGDITQEELQTITGDVSRVFNANSFAALPSVNLQLSTGECRINGPIWSVRDN